MVMEHFGDIYSQYYDLLYQDKDYVGEVKYVDNLIAKFSEGKSKTILDMGCGTGKHAEPVLLPQQNIVNVNYDIFLESGVDKIERKQEVHPMRYLFDSELEIICDLEGFSVECKYEWMSDRSPDLSSWNVVWVVRKL